MRTSRRTVAGASLLMALVIGVAGGLRISPTVMPAATTEEASEVAIPPAGPSPTPEWGGPLPNGAPGPGGSPCIEIDPGACGVVTNYDAGLVPYEPSPRR